MATPSTPPNSIQSTTSSTLDVKYSINTTGPWWKKYLCKKFVYALLTAAAMGAAIFGFDLNVVAVMAMATPIMIGIGAEGWTEAARVTSNNALVMHTMSLEHARNALKNFPVADPPSAEPFAAPVLG